MQHVAVACMQHDFDKHAARTLIRSIVSSIISLVLSCLHKFHAAREATMDTISEAMARYEDEHTFARRLILPEEDRAKYTSTKWEGGYRWFRSPNVVCLEKYRRLKTPRKP
jgi:hypothetical protein